MKIKKWLFYSSIFIIASILLSSTVYAATWQYKYPIVVTDTSGTDRTYVPVMLGFGAQNLIAQGKILSSGLNSNEQIGASNIKYMLSTTNCTAVIPSLPNSGKQTIDLYTGYSPLQTGFSIITGNGGYVTVADNTTIELANNGTVQFTNICLSNGTIFSKANALNASYSTSTGNITVTANLTVASTYPTVSWTSHGNALTTKNITVTLGGAVQSGGMLIALIDNLANPAQTISTPAGWTQLVLTNYDTNSFSYLGAWYKVTTGIEGSTTFTTAGICNQAWVCYYIQPGTYTGVPVIGVTATGSSANPDPPSKTSGFGAVSHLVIAFNGDRGQLSTAAPAGYSGLVTDAILAGLAAIGSATKQSTSATDDPGTFTIAASADWAANTIALNGSNLVTMTGQVASPVLNSLILSANATSGNLELWENGAIIANISLSGGSIVDSSSSWIFGSGFKYCSSISIVASGVQQLSFKPNALINGTTLPDLTSGTKNNGTITWGTNSNLSITYGTPESFESFMASANSTLGYNVPSASMPTTWFGGGSGVSHLPFYDMISAAATGSGVPVTTIYALIIIGLAFCAFTTVILFTKSAFMGVIAMAIVFFVGSSMTVIPMWIPFVILLVDFGIMYLVRQVSY